MIAEVGKFDGIQIRAPHSLEVAYRSEKPKP